MTQVAHPDRRRLLALTAACILGSAFGTALPAQAHRAHAVLTVVRIARDGGLQITHRLHGHDAEVALRLVDRVEAPDLSSLENRARLALYVERRFSIAHADGTPIVLRLLGAERDGEDVLVYQEAPSATPPGLPDALSVRSDILREVFETQENRVNIRIEGTGSAKARSATFRGEDGWKRIDLRNR